MAEVCAHEWVNKHKQETGNSNTGKEGGEYGVGLVGGGWWHLQWASVYIAPTSNPLTFDQLRHRCGFGFDFKFIPLAGDQVDFAFVFVRGIFGF
jgi:hypothetical protein